MKRMIVGVTLAVMMGLGGVLRAEMVTLQQGVGGYGGCQDSFVNYDWFGGDSNPAAPFGGNQYLMLNSERYKIL